MRPRHLCWTRLGYILLRHPPRTAPAKQSLHSSPTADGKSLLSLVPDRVANAFAFRTCFNQQAAVNLTAANPSAPIYLAEFDVGIAYANPSVPFCANKVAHEYVIRRSTDLRWN